MPLRLSLAFALFPLPLLAQSPTGSIAGRVLAAGSELPLAEAVVTVDGVGVRAVTTASGAFRLDSVPPGVYTLRAVAIGYAPAVRTDIAVGSGKPTEVTLVLAPRPIEL